MWPTGASARASSAASRPEGAHRRTPARPRRRAATPPAVRTTGPGARGRSGPRRPRQGSAAWEDTKLRDERAHHGPEAPARLAHRRLLVSHQHGVERARQRAQAHREDGRQGEAEAAADPPAGEAHGVRPGRPAADARTPRVRAAAPGRGQAAGGGPWSVSGSGRCRRKVPVARLTSTPPASRSEASP